MSEPLKDRTYNVLFLCTGNSARSILAETLLNRMGKGRFRAYSAGSFPQGAVNPHTLTVLKRAGFATDDLRSKSWDEFARPGAPELDFVFTVCDNAANEPCPVWPGQPVTAHWGVPDPAAAMGSEDDILHAFRAAFLQLERRIDLFTNLRIDRLDHLALRRHVENIGRHDDSPRRALMPGIGQRLTAEGIGTAFLLMAVVGSGIMGEQLAGGNAAIALLANTLATAAALVVLIAVFGPTSGAHFNPAVTLVFLARREIAPATSMLYIAVQTVSAILGVWLAHIMFALPVVEISRHARDGMGQGASEFVVTFGLIVTILLGARHRPAHVPALVGLYIGAAYWFTASTSFANPAVTIARSLSDTFAGIAPHSAPLFIVAQLAGAATGALVVRLFLSAPAQAKN